MKLTVDYHTHTIFSHGKGTILQNAEQAEQKGLFEIAITDHGFSHPAFRISKSKLPKMRKLCQEAEKSTGVKVLLGIESNILGISGKTDLKQKDYDKFDIFLAGIHKFILYDGLKEWFKLYGANLLTRKFKDKPSKSLIERNTKIYINTIKNNPIDILAHPNYCFFADAVEVAKCCRDYGTLFEIDARKTHLSDEEWVNVANTGVNFIINSDAHVPCKIAEIEHAYKMIERTGISKSQIVNIDGKIPTNLRFKQFKDKM
jgi:putative hydrolase